MATPIEVKRHTLLDIVSYPRKEVLHQGVVDDGYVTKTWQEEMAAMYALMVARVSPLSNKHCIKGSTNLTGHDRALRLLSSHQH